MSKVTLTLLFALTTSVQAQTAVPSPAQLNGLSPQQTLAKANQWRNVGGLQSYVTSKAIVFKFPDGQEKTVTLPKQQMVVAIAPYVNKTHPCETHFTSGCQGEMVNTPVGVLVKDKTGKTLLNKTVKTLPNGFLELRLPRNQTYQVTLKAGGKSTTGTLTTNTNSKTCVTDLRLQ